MFAVKPWHVVVLLVLIAVVVLVVVLVVRAATSGSRARARAGAPARLDGLFGGASPVTVALGDVALPQAELVVAAQQRGYRLAFQGADGSLVFERVPGAA